MIKEIKLPEISENASGGTIAEILVEKGTSIKEEDPVVAVESDKATVEVPSEFAGEVSEILVAEGDEVEEGSVLIKVEVAEEGQETSEKEEKQENEESEEKADQEEQAESQNQEKEQESKKGKEEKQETSPSEKETTDSSDESSDDQHTADENIAAAPLARRLTRELGLDMKDLQSDLDTDRISSKDIMEYVKGKMKSSSETETSNQSPQNIPLPDFSQFGETTRESLTNVRKATAQNTTQSWQNIPHVTHFEDVDVTELEDYRLKLKESKDIKVSLTAFVVKVLGEALKRFPKFNSSLDLEKNELIYKKYYNISMAADTAKGLLMPVIKNVDQKSLQDVQADLKDFVKRGQDGRIGSEEMKGGNIAISNLGTIGAKNFTPVIFPPQVAILGVSSLTTQPSYDTSIEEFVPISVLPLALSYDHRVIDGADAAKFMNWIKEALEHPMSMWV